MAPVLEADHDGRRIPYPGPLHVTVDVEDWNLAQHSGLQKSICILNFVLNQRKP